MEVFLPAVAVLAAAAPGAHGKNMKTGHFLSQLQHDQIIAAIRGAESRTTSHIRVYISHHRAPDPVAKATRHFRWQRLNRHPGRNAVLIFVAPKSQTFAVVGDQAIHQHLGEAFWTNLTAEMAVHFKAGNFTAALLAAINQAGAELARHFPRAAPGDQTQG